VLKYKEKEKAMIWSGPKEIRNTQECARPIHECGDTGKEQQSKLIHAIQSPNRKKKDSIDGR
jgi:hypothetical protein